MIKQACFLTMLRHNSRRSRFKPQLFIGYLHKKFKLMGPLVSFKKSTFMDEQNRKVLRFQLDITLEILCGKNPNILVNKQPRR